jgi:hypothetical protein
MRGLLNRIELLKNRLGYPSLSSSDRAAAEQELSEASRLYDHAKACFPE